jgi:hypothetical protein
MSRILFLVLFVGLCFNVQAKGHHDNDQDDDDQGDHRGAKKTIVIEHRDRDDDDHGDHRGFNKTVVVEKRVVVDRFSDDDRDVIVKYYERKHKRIPPGQAKKMRHYEIVVGEPAPSEVIKEIGRAHV